MSLLFNGPLGSPNYTALSSDIVGGAIPNTQPGRTVYISDTATSSIVRADGQLVPYVLPVSLSVSSIDIGQVDQGKAGSSAWLVDTELPPAAALNGTIAKSVSAPMVGAGMMYSDGTNLVEVDSSHPMPISQALATIPTATVMQNAVSQTATGTDLVTTGYATAIIQIVSSPAMSGGTNVQFWATPDGSTYYPILAHQIGIAANLVTSTTSDGEYRISCAGFKSIEARIANYSAGTTTIKGYVSPVAAFPTTITGLTGGFSATLPNTPVLSVASAYVTGDYVGTSSAPMEFTNIARTSGGTFYIPGATVIDYAKQSVAGELWLFNATVTPPLDSAAWNISAADMAKLLCIVPFSTYYATASYSVSQGHPDYVGPYKAAATSVFGCFVTRGSPSYASLNLTFILGSAQD